MLEPLNTEWNRKTGMLPGKGKVDMIGIKHGIAYFTWADISGNVTFLQCDEGVLKKHFNFRDADAKELAAAGGEKLTLLQQKKTKFLNYPFDAVQ